MSWLTSFHCSIGECQSTVRRLLVNEKSLRVASPFSFSITTGSSMYARFQRRRIAHQRATLSKLISDADT